MGTALTVSFDQARPKKFASHIAMRSGSIAFANYLTNGCALDFSTYFRTVNQVVFSDYSGGYAFEYDYTNKKVKVYSAASDSHIHALAAANAIFTGNAMVANMGNATGNTTSNVVGLGNGKLPVVGNVASVTAGVQFANSQLEMNAAGGNASLAGNTNTHSHVLTMTGSTNSFTPLGVLSGNTDSTASNAGMSEVANSTNFTSVLTGVKFVVYGVV